jgi:hypothetical protein
LLSKRAFVGLPEERERACIAFGSELAAEYSQAWERNGVGHLGRSLQVSALQLNKASFMQCDNEFCSYRSAVCGAQFACDLEGGLLTRNKAHFLRIHTQGLAQMIKEEWLSVTDHASAA